MYISPMTAHSEFHKLDDFSTKVARKLFKQYPLLREQAQVILGSDDRDDDCYLHVRMTSPSSDPQLFSVITENNEIFVGFGAWHNHYNEYHGYQLDGADAEQSIDDAIDIITQILEEKVVLAQAIDKSGEHVEGWLVEATHNINLPEGATGVDVFSWTGRLNKHIGEKE